MQKCSLHMTEDRANRRWYFKNVFFFSSDIDECALSRNQCFYNQICVNTVGSYHCKCPLGYISSGAGQPCVGESSVHLSWLSRSIRKLIWVTRIAWVDFLRPESPRSQVFDKCKYFMFTNKICLFGPKWYVCFAPVSSFMVKYSGPVLQLRTYFMSVARLNIILTYQFAKS
jgi:hypothetical protein